MFDNSSGGLDKIWAGHETWRTPPSSAPPVGLKGDIPMIRLAAILLVVISVISGCIEDVESVVENSETPNGAACSHQILPDDLLARLKASPMETPWRRGSPLDSGVAANACLYDTSICRRCSIYQRQACDRYICCADIMCGYTYNCGPCGPC